MNLNWRELCPSMMTTTVATSSTTITMPTGSHGVKMNAQKIGRTGIRRIIEMANSKKQANHDADIKNANRGTPGTNTTYDKSHGNRGKQLNPNQQSKGK